MYDAQGDLLINCIWQLIIEKKTKKNLSVNLADNQNTNTMAPNLLSSRILWSSQSWLMQWNSKFYLEKYHFLIPTGLSTLNSVWLMTTSNIIKGKAILKYNCYKLLHSGVSQG